ncbi:MAG: 16S rRNA (uracil(1498)-N(3))-methyltransferase [Clostridia bacterium]|nr:16S rRNA (uracil(1498)-N(3))-methyltransferase [Clostridia bacterium]
MPRFFVTPDAVGEGIITITGSDVNHIKNVLRMQAGDRIEICDGRGNDYACVISSLDRDSVLLDIEKCIPSDTELERKIYLFQGLPKSDKMELIIQKAVELGVYEIVPTVTSRCIVKIDAKKEEKKTARWQQISESAAKQSGRGIIPAVKSPMAFNDALKYATKLGTVLIPYEKAKGMAATKKIISELGKTDSIAVFIGPEGGFEEKEIELAEVAGAKAITLGKRILRTETAGLCILAVLMIESEN